MAQLLSRERGQATIFLPCRGTVRPMGRVAPLVVPGAELATTVHIGPHTDIDRAYGALGGYVTRPAGRRCSVWSAEQRFRVIDQLYGWTSPCRVI
jgi:hypothetical protein